MLAPLAESEAVAVTEPISNRMRSDLEREKALTLRSIKELEFDRAMGKLSEKDFDEMATRLRSRAVGLMKQLEQNDSGYEAIIERDLNLRLAQHKGSDAKPDDAASGCGGCGTVNDSDATFCKRCASKVKNVVARQRIMPRPACGRSVCRTSRPSRSPFRSLRTRKPRHRASHQSPCAAQAAGSSRAR